MKLEIDIPESLKEVKLKDFQKYHNIANVETDASFLNIKAIEIFCGLKYKDVRNIKKTDFNAILSVLERTLSEKGIFVSKFNLNGVEYGFIPDLENISSGEWIDLENYLQDVKDWHKAMAVLYRPITFKKGDLYLIEEYDGSEKYAETMKYANVSDVLGAQVFFYHLGIDLLKALANFLTKTEKSLTYQQKQTLQSVTDGIRAFTQSHEATYLNSMKLPNNHLERV